ncbi:hypothetical protein BH10ACT10_BH10ACT10_18820 [soil metagenome]
MDAISEWKSAQGRVTALLTGLSPEHAERRVPACPDWTVRDLLSHMVGLDADVIAGDEPDDHNSTWTQRRVDERRDRSVPELLEEWDGLVEPLAAWMREFTTRPLGDVVIHEQDLRGALGVSGGHGTDGLRALRDRMVGRFGENVASLPPLALDGGTWHWCSSGAVDDAAVVLRASEFALTRAVMSRRSAAQLRGWVVRGDVEPYLSGFEVLGPLPDVDLTD